MSENNNQSLQSLYQKGIELLRSGKTDEAGGILEHARTLFPQSADILFALGNVYRVCGNYGKAAQQFEDALKLRPDFFAARFNLGSAFRELKQYDRAAAHFKYALELKADSFEAHLSLGMVFKEQNRFAEALEELKAALSIRGNSLELFVNLAEVYIGLKNYDDALSCFYSALALSPDSPDILNGLGNTFILKKDHVRAKECYVRALEKNPGFADAHFNLGTLMREWNRLDEAIVCFKNALRFKPDSAPVFVNLGESLLAAGEIKEAEECFRKALQIDPGYCLAEDNLLLAMSYNPSYSCSQLFEEHRKRGSRRIPVQRVFTNDPNPDRRLKIGYLSPDFCKHPAASFMEPVIRNHDRDNFEVFCYSQTVNRDIKTEMFKSMVNNWREIESLDDKKTVELIISDEIDILVDCAGHMNGNRLGVFAQRAAPVQITGFGYPGTTGLYTIDYRLSDSVADPDGEEVCHTEKLIRLESGFCCYAPPENAPEITAPPAVENGYLTFGSTHTLARLNEKVIRLWADVMNAVDRSRLLIFRSTLTERSISRLKAAFDKCGVDPDRIEFQSQVPSPGHLAVYSRIDLLLDTFPWSGHTTACESLWMGVPVITLRGDRHAGRMVACVLSMAGMPEFIAESADDYVRIAGKWAADVDGLLKTRAGLRERISTSSLCDGEKFTRCLEENYRRVWMSEDRGQKSEDSKN
ncbi:MAG: tetratricopeptide repeat protein [Fibrobacter sp.]|nr:tetratricopeptide repeat protein [Fibrobacter sp.]